MTSRSGAAALVALLSSCASVLGVDDERRSAVDAVCECYDDEQDCRKHISTRLDRALAADREAWLQNFHSDACGQGSCSQVSACLALEPTCGVQDDKCEDEFALCCPGFTCVDGECQ